MSTAADLLVKDAGLLVVDGEREIMRRLAGGREWSGHRRRRRGHRTRGPDDPLGGLPPRHAGPGQHPPPHLPEPHPLLRPRRERLPLRLADHPLPPVGRSRRGGRLRLRVRRHGRAAHGWLHDVLGPSLRPSAPPPRRRGDPRRPGHRLPFPRDAGFDDPLRGGRRAPAAERHPDRGRGPRRQRATHQGAPRRLARRARQGRPRPLLPVLRHQGADDGDRRTRGAVRRPAAHPPRRGPRRGHLLPRDVRLAGPSSTSRRPAG